MRKYTFILLFMMLLSAVFFCAAQAKTEDIWRDSEALPQLPAIITLDDLRMAFRNYSAPAVVQALHKNDGQSWHTILSMAAAGDPAWIKAVALYLSPGADGESASDFFNAMRYALPIAPEAVLGLEAELGLSLHNICGSFFYGHSYEFVKNYGDRTKAALRQVKDPDLLDSRDNCLRLVQQYLNVSEKLYREGRWRP